MATEKHQSGEIHRSKPSGLYRSETNKIIAGVCGGLGEYFNIDPLIIRIIFVIITVFGGSGFLIYFILWLIMPSESHASLNSSDTVKQNVDELKSRVHQFADDLRGSGGMRQEKHSVWAVVLILIGLTFLFRNFGFFEIFDLHEFWPVLLIILGLVFLFKK